MVMSAKVNLTRIGRQQRKLLMNRHDRVKRCDRIARQAQCVQSFGNRKSDDEHSAENDHPKPAGVLISPVREGARGMAGSQTPANAKNRTRCDNPEDERDSAWPHVVPTIGRQLWHGAI
jgi:hypothetical protein